MSISPGMLQASQSAFNQEKLDQPEFPGEHNFYIICSTQRSGSNVLCELLQQAGVGVPHEYFHRKTHMPILASRFGLLPLGEPVDQLDLDNYFAQLIRHRTTPSGHFGFKAHISMFQWLTQHCDLDQVFPNLKYVFIRREDSLAQAVSLTKAGQTNQWTSEQISRNTPVYSYKQIKDRMQYFNDANEAWLYYFNANNIDYHEITYESLIADTDSVCRNLLQFLNAESDSEFALEKLELRPQSNRINLEWVERFKSDQKSLS